MNARILWRRGWIVAVALAGMVGLVACLPVPLGDPSKSKADSRLVGVWEWRDARINTVVIRQWDEKTYVIDAMVGDVADNGVRPHMRTVYKGWLTEVKGQTFLTMQPVEIVGAMNGDVQQKTFLVARIKLEGTTLTALGVTPDFKALKDVASPAALEKVIAENLDDPKLYAQPIVATKWNVEQMKGLEKLVETFREWKPQ